MPLKPTRIKIPNKDWTPFWELLFERVFPALHQKTSALIFSLLYDGVRHSVKRRVWASAYDLANRTGLDWRTVQKCLEELKAKQFIACVDEGLPRSRTKKPCWRVPLAEDKGHYWIPVPRFILRDYCKVFPNAILLLPIIWHQHKGWHNFANPSLNRLAQIINWSSTTVSGSLRVLADQHLWREIGGDLPLPLDFMWPQYSKWPHQHGYRVRFLRYDEEMKTVRLDKKFEEYFHVEESDLVPEYIDESRRDYYHDMELVIDEESGQPEFQRVPIEPWRD